MFGYCLTLAGINLIAGFDAMAHKDLSFICTNISSTVINFLLY